MFINIFIGNPRYNGLTLDAIERLGATDGDIGSFQRRQQRSNYAIGSQWSKLILDEKPRKISTQCDYPTIVSRPPTFSEVILSNCIFYSSTRFFI